MGVLVGVKALLQRRPLLAGRLDAPWGTPSMARPRWHLNPPPQGSRIGRLWDRSVALWAAINLLLVGFDLTYVPLRTFWLQRNLYPIPSVPLAVPLTALPNITPWVDPIKGIEPHRETSAYLRQFRALDAAMDPSQGPGGRP